MTAYTRNLTGIIEMTATRRPLTVEEIAWKDNLKAAYKRKRNELGLTQEKLADLCGWKTQAAVSNYMNGVIPLNTDAKLKFAKALQISVDVIDPKMRGTTVAAAAPTTAGEFFALHGGLLENMPLKELMKIVGRIDSIVDRHLAKAKGMEE